MYVDWYRRIITSNCPTNLFIYITVRTTELDYVMYSEIIRKYIETIIHVSQLFTYVLIIIKYTGNYPNFFYYESGCPGLGPQWVPIFCKA